MVKCKRYDSLFPVLGNCKGVTFLLLLKDGFVQYRVTIPNGNGDWFGSHDIGFFYGFAAIVPKPNLCYAQIRDWLAVSFVMDFQRGGGGAYAIMDQVKR